jgi:hypothetical protein
MIAQPTNHNKTHRRQGNSHMKLNKTLIGINMVPTPKTNSDYTLFIVRIYNEPKGDVHDEHEFDTHEEANAFIMGFCTAIECTHKKWAIAARTSDGVIEDVCSNEDTL